MPTDSRMLFQIFHHDVMTTTTTGLSPSPTVNFMILELVEGKGNVTELAEGRTQGARRCLGKKKGLFVTYGRLREVLSLLKS